VFHLAVPGRLKLAMQAQPTVGSLSIDSNKWAIFKYLENPPRIFWAKMIFLEPWASGNEGP
jgi:hypothetical protein